MTDRSLPPIADFFLSDSPDAVMAAITSLSLPVGQGPSHGRLTRPEGINTRTQKPERDGVRCARVFGPVVDFECLCGKYKGQDHAGVRCEKCGVECIASSSRQVRWGHIELAVGLLHPVLEGRVCAALGLPNIDEPLMVVTVCLPALIRSASTSSSVGKGPMPSMPFSLCSHTSLVAGTWLATSVGMPMPRFT